MSSTESGRYCGYWQDASWALISEWLDNRTGSRESEVLHHIRSSSAYSARFSTWNIVRICDMRNGALLLK